MYEKYLIELPQADSAVLNAKSARSVLGAALQNVNMSIEDQMLLFAREANGDKLQRTYRDNGLLYAAPAPVIIGGGDRRVVLVALGKDGVELLRRNLVVMANALSKFTKSPWSMRSYSGDCSLSAYGTRMYHVPTFILEKNKRRFQSIMDRSEVKDGIRIPTLENVDNLIKRAIVNGLIGQALMHDEQDGSKLMSQMPSVERLGINVVSGSPFFFKIHKDSHAHAIAIKNLMFSMDAELKGEWFVGQLRSRMLGQIKPLLPRDLEFIEASEKSYRARGAVHA